jgi:NADH-quinone oxidoreductase subunit E
MLNLSKDQVKAIMEKYGNDPQQLIAILLDIQAASGKNFVEKQWAELASEILNVSLAKIYDVLTFYAMFSTKPRGEFVIEICRSTPCAFGATEDTKADTVVKWFQNATGAKIGETTTDGKITLMYSSCCGMCQIGPVAKIGSDVFGNLTQEKVNTLVKCCIAGNKQELESLCQN